MGHYIFKHTLNCAFVGADDTFIFQATSLNSVNIQVFKERILTAICDLNDRTFGQNSKLQVNVLQCKYMVNTIVTSKFYLMGETCATLADPIYKELLRIVQKADLIVQECSDEPLNLKSILVEMDNIRAFVAVIVDWQSCTRLFRKDIDNWSRESVHSRLEPLKAQDIQKNKELWDPRIAELRQLMMSNASGSRTGERINLADYLQWRVQNVMNVLPQGLLPWCVLASDPEAKRGEYLGKGAFGSVFQCTWFGMACAEKSFNPFLDENQKRDFENEVGVMVRLNHPHVVRLIFFHQDSTKCSIVMELMPTNLERHIEERKVSHKPFTPQAAVDVMSQIASAMEYLHGQGVVHRDLKPNNILVSPNTNPELSADGYVEVKLADFGLAKTKVNTSSSMLHSQICGAATWRAPEAFPDHEGHQRPFPPKKADVYSFAILCSQILSGKLYPFGYPPVRLLERISSPQNERPFLPSNNNYHAQLLSLIKQCWELDPHMRPNFSTICSSL
jgi:tRNA A-37 threonylcarbamoyl transferase component Bud32